jgi:broad specificity phosphatase PhoE
MPDHLLVIRSAASDYERLGRIRGTLDLPLSTDGEAEATAAAQAIAVDPPAAIYSAADACSTETAEIIARATGLRARSLGDFSNLDLGLWQGMLVDDIRRKQPRVARQWEDNPWSVLPPDGESLDDACDRLGGGLERMLKRHPSGRIALVVPHPVDRLVRWLVAGEALGDLWDRGTEAPVVVELPVAAQWLQTARRQAVLR